MDCLFCKIISDDIPCEKIYEDDLVYVFLDIHPTTNGDTLIIPKKHYLDFRDVDSNTLLHMYDIIKKLYPMYQEKLHCDGLTISHNSDYAQEIKHFHIHFIPRYKNDNVRYFSDKDILKDLKEIEEILLK